MKSPYIEFTCWKCHEVLIAVPGEHFILSAWVTCPGCGEAQALTYKFPEANSEMV